MEDVTPTTVPKRRWWPFAKKATPAQVEVPPSPPAPAPTSVATPLQIGGQVPQVRRQPPTAHPRAEQILRLHASLSRRRAELVVCESEREAEAAPVALEIEAIEAEIDASVTLRSEMAKASLSVDNLIYDAVGERDRLAAELAEATKAVDQLFAIRDLADEAQVEARDRKVELEQKLTRTRERFDDVRLTSRGRAVMRKIESIERHIERILDRHPEARIYQLEVEIQREAAQQGIMARVLAVNSMMRSPEFAAAFDKAIDEAKNTPRLPQTPNQMRALAFEVLHALGLSTEDVTFRVTWDAKAKTVTFIAPGIHPEARQRIIDLLLARGGPPGAEEAA